MTLACRGTEPEAQEPLLESEDDPLASDGVDRSRTGLRRGQPGSASGQPDYCDNPASPCDPGQGDCDSSAQCSGGAVCTADNGGRYPGPFANQQDDHCAPASCSNRVMDGLENGIDCGTPECGSCTPACELSNGHTDRCSYHCPCPPTFGDCDADDACEGGVGLNPSRRCVPDVGARFAMPAGHDVCLPAHCRNRRRDFDLGETVIDGGGPCGSPVCPNPIAGNECTPSCRCAPGEGDCDSDLDCAPGLRCAEEGAIDRCRGVLLPTDCTGLDFDGIDDWAAVPNVPSATTFTIEAWVRGFAAGPGAMVPSLGWRVFGTNCGSLSWRPEGFHVEVFPACNGTGTRYTTDLTPPMPFGVLPSGWFHLAFVVPAADQARIYIDGQLVTSRDSLAIDNGVTGLYLGSIGALHNSRVNTTYAYTRMSVASFRVSSTARYGSAFTPDVDLPADATTVLRYAFDEGSGAQLSDSTGGGRTGILDGAPLWLTDGPNCAP